MFVDTQSWMKKQSEEEEEDDCMDDKSLAEVKMAMDTIFFIIYGPTTSSWSKSFSSNG